MHLFLTFPAALGNMSKLYCTRLHENWRRLGIIQVNLASALALHKRSIFEFSKRCYYVILMIKMMTMKKPILYFDMDNVLVDFQSGIDATPTRSLVYSSTHLL